MIYQKTKMNDRTKLREPYNKWVMYPLNKYTKSKDMKIDERDWSEFFNDFPPPNAPVMSVDEVSGDEGEEKIADTGFRDFDIDDEEEEEGQKYDPMKDKDYVEYLGGLEKWAEHAHGLLLKKRTEDVDDEEAPSQPQPPKEDGKPVRREVKDRPIASGKPIPRGRQSKGKRVDARRMPSNPTVTAKRRQQRFSLDGKEKQDLKPPEPVDSMIR